LYQITHIYLVTMAR